MKAREVIRETIEQRRAARIDAGLRNALPKAVTIPDDDADAILAALAREGLAMVRSDFVASKMVDAAHFLLCYNYQGFAKDDPPRGRDGNCIWRVWHLAPEARDHMTAAEQELFDALMPALSVADETPPETQDE